MTVKPCPVANIVDALPTLVRNAAKLDNSHAHQLFVADLYRLNMFIAEFQVRYGDDLGLNGRFDAARGIVNAYECLSRVVSLTRGAGL